MLAKIAHKPIKVVCVFIIALHVNMTLSAHREIAESYHEPLGIYIINAVHVFRSE